MTPPPEACLDALVAGPAWRFDGFPDGPGCPDEEALPLHAKGVYTVWLDAELLFVGTAGLGVRPAAPDRALDRARPGTPWGLRVRLAAHAKGWRAGDQMSVLVADRLILPTLSADEVAAVAAGDDSLDRRVRLFVAERLTFRVSVQHSTRVTLELERSLRLGERPCGRPRLNPLRIHPMSGRAVADGL